MQLEDDKVADLDKGQEFISRTQKLFGSRNEGNSALNKTMSSFATSQAKIFKSLDSSIQNLNKNLEGMTKATDKKKSFVKREDPSTKLYKAVDDLESLMRENNKLQQQEKKKKSSFWSDLAKNIKMIGVLAAGAGLLGFLLTGDVSYLRGITKGIAKIGTKLYGAIFNGVDNAIKATKEGWKKAAGWSDEFLMQPLKKGWTKAAGWVDGFMGPLKTGFSKMKGFTDDLVLGLKGGFDNVLRSVGGLADNIIGKIAKSGAGKLAAKGGKAVGKVAGKAGKFIGGIGKKAGGMLGKKGLAQTAKSVPIIGGAVNAVFAIDKAMKGDFVGAGMELSAGAAGLLDLVAPPAGSILSTTIEVASLARDVTREFTDKEKVAEERAKGGLFKALGFGKKGDAIELKDGKAPTKPKSIGMFDNLKNLAEKTTASLGWKTGESGVAGPISGLQLADSNVDFAGLDPSLQHNFIGMVSEWLSLPSNAKRRVQVNSANRSIAAQTALQKSRPGYAAAPGKSMHNFGRAIDINSREANDMWNSGIMKKWGFEQPGVQQGWKKPEPWHIEPIGQSSSMVRAGLAQPMDTPSAKTQVGDAYQLKQMSNMNLPSGSIGGKVGPKTNSKIDLSEATIQALAAAMGSSFSRAMPRGKSSGAPSPNVSMRG